MATYTATTFSAQPAAAMYGGATNWRTGSFVFPAASSVGDVVFLCRVPHGAQVVSFKEDHSTGATAQGLDFGWAKGGADGGGASFSALLSGGAQGAINRSNVLGADQTAVSVSDNDAQRWAILACKVASGSATTSLKVNFTIGYVTNGPA